MATAPLDTADEVEVISSETEVYGEEHETGTVPRAGGAPEPPKPPQVAVSPPNELDSGMGNEPSLTRPQVG